MGTVDQALSGALPGKWIHFKLLALANAHIVIDEVHTLDQYQTKLLEGLLPWLAATNTRVTFLTATMPSWQRSLLLRAYGGDGLNPGQNRFPATDQVEVGRSKSVVLQSGKLKIRTDVNDVAYDALVSHHVDWHAHMRDTKPHARLGIICNTVARAQEVAQRVVRDGHSVVLLHSQMTAEHRRTSADQLLNAIGPKGIAVGTNVVGTQAIEASLDIDLDFLETELCPAPSFLQRAGRVWRRLDSDRAMRVGDISDKTIHVARIMDEDPWKSRPYLRAELEQTAAWLRKHDGITIPADAQSFVDSASIDLEALRDDDDYYDALAEYVTLLNAGVRNRASISFALSEYASVDDWAGLTQGNEKDEQKTRLIDEGSKLRLILGGDPDIVLGAWQHGIDELVSAHSGDRDLIREALRGSITLRVSDAKRRILADAGLTPIVGSRSLLAAYSFLQKHTNSTIL